MTAARAFIAGACAGTSVILAARILRNRRPHPLPQRTSTPPGLPEDGAPLTWGETVAWNELLCRYGPGEPAWPGAARRGRQP